MNSQLNGLLNNLLKDENISSQISDLISEQQGMGRTGGALNLTQYQVAPFQGFSFAEGGTTGQDEPPEKGTPRDIIQSLGLDAETYERYKSLVMFHETGGSLDPKQKQIGGGPGRGLFQFEPDAAKTAATRLKRYYQERDLTTPDVIERFSKKGGDASLLSPEDQELLFTGQMMKVSGTPEEGFSVGLDPVFSGDFKSIDDFSTAWFENHNKSKKSKRTDRTDKFIEDAGLMLNVTPKTPFTIKGDPSAIKTEGDKSPTDIDSLFKQLSGQSVPQAGLGKFFKNRWDDVKKIGKGVVEGAKGFADFQLGLVGMGDVLDDTFVDRSKGLSAVNNVMGTVARTALDTVIPGAGSAVGAIGSSINGAVNEGRANKKSQQTTDAYNNSAAGGLEQLMEILGSQGFGGGQNPLGALAGLFSGGLSSFENGGITQVVPEGLNAIQTETYKGVKEQIIFNDGRIVDVNAKKSHEKMAYDEVTDVVPEGTYIASARPKMKIKVDSLRDVIFGHTSLTYDEHAQGKVPEEITAADIIRGKKKEILPSEYATEIKKAYPLIKREYEDMFTNAANGQNIESRLPYIQALVSMGESNRMSSENGGDPVFKNGGFIKPVNRYFAGGAIGAGLGVVGSIGSGIAGAINAGAQRRSLERQQQQLTGLTSNLQNLNNQGTAIGIAGQLAQQTDLPELNLDFSRLENFNTQTPQSLIDAAARPTNDINAVLDRLGDRGGIAAFANQSSQQMTARNQAANQAFAQQRNTDLSLAQQLTQGYSSQEQFNNNLRQQEIAARNSVFNNIAGQMQGNLQNNANIQSNQYSVNSALDMQRAGLRGSGLNSISQSLVNAGGIMSSSALDEALDGIFSGNSGVQAPPPQPTQFLQQVRQDQADMRGSQLNGSIQFGTPLPVYNPFLLPGGYGQRYTPNPYRV